MSAAKITGSDTFIRGADVAVEALEPGIRRQMLGYGTDLMMCRVLFDKGAEGSVHSHPHSQSIYIESGRFLITVDGKEQELGAGDSAFVTSNVMHGAVCLEEGVILDTFSPAREDFLGEGA